jgi:8-oxo-dGTP pyrophosphatase MutT (NUDIX family)
MSEAQAPKTAASVILLRPAQPRGFEVLLSQRPAAMAFLGGMYCFPGGTMRDEDCSDGMLCRSRGFTAHQARDIVGAHFAPRKALGLWLAAIRKLFEEVGVLLATQSNGERITLNKARLAQMRSALLAKSLSFQSLLENEDLLCDTARLVYFSHWQTPADVATRLDTRFFVAALPEHQTPLAASYEVAHSLWLTPDRALQLLSKDELPMIFPTFASLRTLADFDSLDCVLREFRSRRFASPHYSPLEEKR